jgi:predicted  nucleic acid-binding Zn-ribbon protein
VPSQSLNLLLELQEQDLALDRIAYRLRTLPERAVLEAAEKQVSALRTKAADLESERAELASSQESLERQIDAVTGRIGTIDARSRSSAAGSYRDQQAMSAEMDSLVKQRRALEDREIEIMERLEPVEAALAGLEKELQGGLAAAAEAREALSVAEAALAAERAEVESRRQPLAVAVRDELRETYDRLRAKLGGVGVARVTDGLCSGCHLRLPASERDRLAHSDEGSVSFCEQCGRILVP